MNPKTLAIFGVFAVALYLIFGKSVAGGTVITGSTLQPTPLSTAGGITGLESSIAGLFGSIEKSAAPTAAQIAAGVPAGASTAPDTNYLDGQSLAQFYSSGLATESVSSPTLIPTSSASLAAPTAPVVATAGPNSNLLASILPNNTTAGLGGSLDATNQSIGYVPPPPGSVALSQSTSLDDLDPFGSDPLGLSLS